MNWTEAQRKQLIVMYPYLQPRNLWTGKIADDYSYTYLVGEHSCPSGWERLFFLYCKNIEPLLAKQHCSKFMFSDIKEKYGTLRMHDFGAPKSCILCVQFMNVTVSTFVKNVVLEQQFRQLSGSARSVMSAYQVHLRNTARN